MKVFELVYPGTWLKYSDPSTSFQIQSILYQIESTFVEAVLSLNYFVEQQNINDRYQVASDESNIRQKFEEDYINKIGTEQYYMNYGYHRSILEMEYKRHRWNQGILPQQYEHQIIFIYAKSFLYAMDAISKLLNVLSKENGVPSVIKEVVNKFRNDFPDLQGVRNTSQHIEDRIRMKGQFGSLDIKPVDNQFIAGGSKPLILSNLSNNKFGSTMGNGIYGEVEISNDSLLKVQKHIQLVLDGFEWEGPTRHTPS